MPTLPQKAAADKPGEVDWAVALQAEMLTVVRQAIEHLVGAELAGHTVPQRVEPDVAVVRERDALQGLAGPGRLGCFVDERLRPGVQPVVAGDRARQDLLAYVGPAQRLRHDLAGA